MLFSIHCKFFVLFVCVDFVVHSGGAFGMGCIGGFLWHFGKGWRNSPRGEKVSGALYSSRMRAPILGGQLLITLHY